MSSKINSHLSLMWRNQSWIWKVLRTSICLIKNDNELLETSDQLSQLNFIPALRCLTQLESLIINLTFCQKIKKLVLLKIMKLYLNLHRTQCLIHIITFISWNTFWNCLQQYMLKNQMNLRRHLPT